MQVGYAEIAILSQYLASLHMLWSIPAATAVNLAATNHAAYITLVAGERPSLLMAGNNDKVYDKKPQRYAKDNVMQWLIWNLSNNNKRLRTSYFIEANYWWTQSIALPLCNSRVTFLCMQNLVWQIWWQFTRNSNIHQFNHKSRHATIAAHNITKY